MNLIVQKYGGSSVADVERMRSVAEKISNKVREGYKVIVVVSAMGKTTDQLIELAKSVSKEPDPREMDMLLTTGEQISAALLSIRLRDMGIRSKSFNAFQMGIK
ncbi:MAG: aspartate kinase, partial [Thermotoga sp.]